MSKNFTNANKFGPQNTETDIWLTPQWIIDKIGPFDLDPCGHLPNGKPIVKTAENYFTEQNNGLTQPWFGDVFVNFPYSDSFEWLKKCKDEFLSGRVASITVLCFARTETKAWQENVNQATGINLIKKRVKFLTKDGVEKSNGNAPSCLIAFGESAFSKIKNIEGIIVRIEK